MRRRACRLTWKRESRILRESSERTRYKLQGLTTSYLQLAILQLCMEMRNETIVAEVKDNSLVLSPEVGERLGWKAGTKLLIERHNGTVIICPQELTAEEIADIACIYLIKYVGDATDVKTPVWKDGKWRVEVVLSYRPETVGFLTFSPDGRLAENESDSPAKMKGIVK